MKVVAPGGKRAVPQRMQAASQLSHDFYMKQGDKQGADQSAFEVAQYGVSQSRNHGVEAIKALQRGDTSAAIAQLTQGYDWLPNGKHAVVQGGQLIVVGADNKAEMTIPINPQTIGNLAMGMASGKLGWDVLQHSAGVPPAQTQAVSPAAPSRPAAQPQAAPAGPATPPAAPPQRPAAAPLPPSTAPA